MKRTIAVMLAGIALMLGNVSDSRAEIKEIRMTIAGSLCGYCVFNVKKAVGRLDFAPKGDDIKIVDIKRGLGVFTPKPDKQASFAKIKSALKKTGYVLASAEIIVSGTLIREESNWFIEIDSSKQRFALEGPNLTETLADAASGASIEITGDWQTVGKDASSREVIRPTAARKTEMVPVSNKTSFDERE